LVAIVATARISELQMIHNVVAIADVERAAFFAARSQGADLSAQRIWGVSDPHLSPSYFAPGR
jgi:hypothetical protein